MRSGALVKYRYANILKASGIFLAVTVLLCAAECVYVYARTYIVYDNSGMLWTAAALAVLSFETGFIACKSGIKMSVQNGFSRQEAFYSFVLLLPINAVFAAFSQLLYYIYYLTACSAVRAYNAKEAASDELIKGVEQIPSYGFFTSGEAWSAAEKNAADILLMTLLLCAAMSFGYVIHSIYYNMTSFGKLVFSVCGGAAAIVLLLMIDIDVFGYVHYYLCAFISGNSELGSFYFAHTTVAMLVLTAVFLSVSQLVCRKTHIRK